jgi:carbonic anhydrase/acetyltransferase-like protein (isoleucine patch superfamily)
MPIHPFQTKIPILGEDVFIAPGAHVIGDVVLGAKSSVWFNAVIRGDVFHIRIGSGTNIQDNTVIHVTTDRNATLIGNDVTVGHSAILHGCTIHDGALIGMGAVVMDRCVVGTGAFVAAGSLVSEGTEIPPGMLALGRPARVVRPLKPQEIEHVRWAPVHYAELAHEYVQKIGRGF